MRVGLVVYGSIDQVSGGYAYDRQLAARLQHAGHTVDVLSLPGAGYVRALGHNASQPLIRAITAGNYDLLLQDELCHPSLFAHNRRIRKVASAPIVSIVHHLRSSEQHPPVWRPLYRAVERAYLHSVDGFIINSNTTLAAVRSLSRHPLPPHMVAVPAGDRFTGRTLADVAAQPPQHPLNIIFVGNLIARKGVHTLLHAVARLPPSSIRLAVVGGDDADPRYAMHVTRLIDRLGLAVQVTRHGRVDDAALAGLLAQADVLAVPSRYEGFGIVYLEGMAFGLPAVATTGGAAHELITDGENGLLVPPDDSGALAVALQLLLANPDRLHAMQQAARRRFQSHPTWAQSMAGAVQFVVALAGRAAQHV